MVSDCVDVSRKRETASASTETIEGLEAFTMAEVVSATSTAGNTCASLTSSMAAIAAGPANSGTNT